jgi:CelD/BcsL family acetyltransferase involved in cellulose biosynthesis
VELERFEDAVTADAEWADLARASGNPFATPEWCGLWLEHAAAGARPRFFRARRPDGGAFAVLPLVVTHGRYVRKLRLAGFGAANELGPVAAPGDREQAAEALRRGLDLTRGEWDLFVGESLPGEGWPARTGAALVGRLGSPVAVGPWNDWDDYLATRSANLRQELRRKERRLLERGARFGTVGEAAELEPALDTLFALHRARWGDGASPWFAGIEGFHRAFARVAFDRGWLRLRSLELDGRTAVAYLGFRFGDAEWFYQLGRDPDAESSLGLVLVAHALRSAIEEGAHEFRLGPGAQAYKLRFATGDRGLETVGLARSLRGRLALRAALRRGA